MSDIIFLQLFLSNFRLLSFMHDWSDPLVIKLHFRLIMSAVISKIVIRVICALGSAHEKNAVRISRCTDAA